MAARHFDEGFGITHGRGIFEVLQPVTSATLLDEKSALRAERLSVARLPRQHAGDQRLGFLDFPFRDERFGQIHARSRIVRRRLLERNAQLTLGIDVLLELPQQLPVVLAHARAIGIELQGSRECSRGHRERAVAVRQDRKCAERERVLGIEACDRPHVLDCARNRGALCGGGQLEAIVILDMRARIGQPRIVKRAAATRPRGVAETAEPLFLFGRNRIGLGPVSAGREPLDATLKFVGHAARAVRLLGREVPLLAGILCEVVQLGLMADDQLPVALCPFAQRRPVAVQAAEQTLAVQRVAGERTAGHQRAQIAAQQVLVAVESHECHGRRQNIDRPDAIADHAATRHIWSCHDQRHAHRRLIDEHAVRQLVMFAETLAVVGECHHIRVCLVAGRSQPLGEAREL